MPVKASVLLLCGMFEFISVDTPEGDQLRNQCNGPGKSVGIIQPLGSVEFR